MRSKVTGKFTIDLLRWHDQENDRMLPWKLEKDPYKIWISEVILQQTRAKQALPYYQAFLSSFPTIADLATAPDDDVFRLWQGLGYYNRCKNMLAAARHVTTELKGEFPDKYEDIRALKGVGDYTAAAIASFAFDLPYAVLDGNVYRVLSRHFGITTPVDSTKGKYEFRTLVQGLLPSDNAASFNQAIMDLGATICTPARPKCEECPVSVSCRARTQSMQSILPVKSKKITVRKRYFFYAFIIFEDCILLRKRTAGDIWGNLYEPVLIENGGTVNKMDILNEFKSILNKSELKSIDYQGYTNQRLTHQLKETHFILGMAGKKNEDLPEDYTWFHINQLTKLAFPKTLLTFLKNNLYL